MSLERFKRIGALAAFTALSQVPGDVSSRIERSTMSQATDGNDQESAEIGKKVVDPEGRDSTEKNRALLTGLLRFIKVLESLPDPRLSTVSSEAGSPAVSENDSESTSAEDTEDAEPGPRDSELSEEERAAKEKLQALLQEKFPDMKFKITNSTFADDEGGPTHAEFNFRFSDDDLGVRVRPEIDGTFTASDWGNLHMGRMGEPGNYTAEDLVIWLKDYFDDYFDPAVAAEFAKFISYMNARVDANGKNSKADWKSGKELFYNNVKQIRESRKKK